MEAVHIATPQPNARDAEQAVLGALMLEREAIGQVADFLAQEHFYAPDHQYIYRAIQRLARGKGPIDILTVMQELKRTGKLDTVGGAGYIASLTNGVTCADNIQWHARIIIQKYMLRVYRSIGARLIDIDDNEDVFDIQDWLNEQAGKINCLTTDADPENAAEIMDKLVKDRDMPLFITADMGDLDRHFAMGPKQITVIGARPAVGKTAFALNMAMNFARQGYRTLFITLEMSSEQLVARIGGALTGIDSERITRNEINDDERQRLADAAAHNGAWIPKIIIADLATLSSGQMFGLLEKAVKKHGCKVAILDYIQLMSSREDGRYEKLTAISIACKQAAKATGIRLIELSQLKRRDGAETDPIMSDLRESGQLEADGDVIMLLGRPEGTDTLLVKVVKNKIGPVGSVELPYHLLSQKIGVRSEEFATSQFPITQPKEKPFDDNKPF